MLLVISYTSPLLMFGEMGKLLKYQAAKCTVPCMARHCPLC